MNLITGKKGEAHVTSLQHRNIIGSIVGNGSYIAQLYNRLAPSVSGNVLTIQSGVLLHHGCAMQVDYGTTDTVNLTPGTAGYYRSDLVVARWTEDSTTGNETVAWVVLQGTPTTTRPAAFPSYNSGNMQEGALVDDCPVYAVSFDGVTITVDTIPNILQTSKEIETIQGTLSGAIAVTTETLTGMSATLTPGDNTLTIPFTTQPSGIITGETYSAIGLIGVQTAGNGSSFVRLRGFGVASGGHSAYVKMRNDGNSEIQPTIGISVLWAKDNILL